MNQTQTPIQTSSETDGPAPDRAAIDLAISGMTCASCAARIEKKLNRLPGVEANVNYAIEAASVHYDPATVGPDELVAAVSGIGYGATYAKPFDAPRAPGPTGLADSPEALAEHRASALLRRLVVAAILGGPVILISMVPSLQFSRWPWLALALTTPVATWAAWPFHRAAAMNARHGVTTMDTLVSLGVVAAFGWSIWALILGDAGRNNMKMGFHFGASGADELYFEVASAVTIFLLAGRTFEARAKTRAGSALRALLNLGAKDVTILNAADEERLAPIGELLPGSRFVVRPGEKIATDGIVESGTSAIDASLLTGESVPVEVGPGSIRDGHCGGICHRKLRARLDDDLINRHID